LNPSISVSSTQAISSSATSSGGPTTIGQSLLREDLERRLRQIEVADVSRQNRDLGRSGRPPVPGPRGERLARQAWDRAHPHGRACGSVLLLVLRRKMHCFDGKRFSK
jgi:hypothetical protein